MLSKLLESRFALMHDIRELCIWIFDRLSKEPPFLMASRDVTLDIDDLIDRAERGETMWTPELHWSYLIQDLFFTDPSENAYPISGKLFHLVSSLGSAFDMDLRKTNIRGSLEKLLELSVGCQDEDRMYIQIEGTSDHWKITTTALGEKEFGQPVEICFREHCPLDNLTFWTWPVDGAFGLNI